jgi:lysophospholipase L1-like esterase
MKREWTRLGIVGLLLAACLQLGVAQEAATKPAASKAAIPVAPNPFLQKNVWFGFHSACCRRAAKGDVDLVFLGDSIAFGWTRAGGAVWKKYYANRKAANLGLPGDRTENVLWRVDHGNFKGISPKLVVVLIGTNNLYGGPKLWCTGQEIADGVTAIVQRLRAVVPGSKILLMGVFPRAAGRALPEDFARRIDAANELMAKLADQKTVFYRDISAKLVDKDGKVDRAMLGDGLHLSAAGYEVWAQAIEADVAGALGDKGVADKPSE